MDKSFVIKAFTPWKEAKINLTETPYLKGQSFEGWSLESQGALIDEEYQFVRDTYIYPIWQISYIQVNLNLGNGVSETSYIRIQRDSTYAENITAFDNVEIDYLGYKLKHWSLTRNGNAVSNDYVFTANVTFYAVYEIDYIIIYLNSISELSQPSLSIQRGSTFASFKDQIQLTLEGYTFLGWSVNPDGDPLLNNNYQFMEDCNIYAVFEFDNRVDVNFHMDTDQNSSNIITKSIKAGTLLKDALKEIDIPSRNYTLYGWSKSHDYNNLVDSDLHVINEPSDFYAIWTFEITLKFENTYQQFLDTSGIVGTFICRENETVSDLFENFTHSQNYVKISNFSTTFLFDKKLYKNNNALSDNYVLRPNDKELSVKLNMTKMTYEIEVFYDGDSEYEDELKFKFDAITTVNDLYNEFKKHASGIDYDKYGEVVGFDYNNGGRGNVASDPSLYDDGLYLNFNVLNGQYIDFAACEILMLTLAIRQTTPITLKRGWRYPNAFQINNLMVPYTNYMDPVLRDKIIKAANITSNLRVIDGSHVYEYLNYGFYLRANKIDDSEEDSYGYNYVAIIPSIEDAFYAAESIATLESKESVINLEYENTGWYIVLNTSTWGVGTKTIELAITSEDSHKVIENFNNVYNSVTLNVNLKTRVDKIGIYFRNKVEGRSGSIYLHDQPLNGVNRYAALIIRDPDTYEALEIIQLNNVKVGDICGIKTKRVTGSFNSVFYPDKGQMTIISEDVL